MTNDKSYVIIYNHSLFINYLVPGMISLLVVMQSFPRAKHKRALRALVGKNIRKVLSFNVFLEIAFVSHCLIADSTVKWAILRSQNVLIKILLVCDETWINDSFKEDYWTQNNLFIYCLWFLLHSRAACDWIKQL